MGLHWRTAAVIMSSAATRSKASPTVSLVREEGSDGREVASMVFRSHKRHSLLVGHLLEVARLLK